MRERETERDGAVGGARIESLPMSCSIGMAISSSSLALRVYRCAGLADRLLGMTCIFNLAVMEDMPFKIGPQPGGG